MTRIVSGRFARLKIALLGAALLVAGTGAVNTAHAAKLRPANVCSSTYWNIIAYSYPSASNGRGESLQAILYGEYDSLGGGFCQVLKAEADAYVPQSDSGGGTETAKLNSGTVISNPVGSGGLHGTDYYVDSPSSAIRCGTAYVTWNAPGGSLSTSVYGCG